MPDTDKKNDNIPLGFTLRHTLRGHTNEIFRIAWSPDGKILASPSSDKTIRLWDAQTGHHLRTLKGHSNTVYSVAWSPDGKTLASGSDDKTIRLWNPDTGLQTSILEGHTSYVKSVSLSYDGLFLASKSFDGTVRLWRTGTWETVAILEEPASDYWPPSLAFHPNAPVLATLGEGNTVIRIWDLDIST